MDEEHLEARTVETLHTTPIFVRRTYEVERELLNRRSNYTLIVRALADVNRVVNVTKGIQHESTLTPSELYSTRAQLARAAQVDVYNQEIELLSKGKELPIKNRLAALHPFLDDSGTMRVGGRLQNSSLVRCETSHHHST